MRGVKARGEKSLKVIFRPKSSWQRDDCLRPGCQRPATLEAHLAGKKRSADIRCCNHPVCKRHASQLAKDAMSGRQIAG